MVFWGQETRLSLNNLTPLSAGGRRTVPCSAPLLIGKEVEKTSKKSRCFLQVLFSFSKRSAGVDKSILPPVKHRFGIDSVYPFSQLAPRITPHHALFPANNAKGKVLSMPRGRCELVTHTYIDIQDIYEYIYVHFRTDNNVIFSSSLSFPCHLRCLNRTLSYMILARSSRLLSSRTRTAAMT